MLALIAGQGALPDKVVQSQAETPLICALQGFAPDHLTPDITFRLETLGSLLIELGKRGVTDVCFAGAIQRPQFDPSALDAETAPLVPILQAALQDGDDGALRAVIGLFEQTGFTIRAAHDLAPDLIPPPGVLSDVWPTGQQRKDAARGAEIIAAMGAVDVGQACVVKDGQALGIETVAGTDWMLKTLPKSPDPKDALLVKMTKPGQDARADLPTIGSETVRQAAALGLGGIVINEGGAILLDRAEVIATCNDHGMILWVRGND